MKFAETHVEQYGLLLGSLVNDLFMGSPCKYSYSASEYNKSIITLKESGEKINFDIKEKIIHMIPIAELMPEVLNKPKSFYQSLVNSKDKNFTLGKIIQRTFNDNPQKTIELFDKKFLSFMSLPAVHISYFELESYLSQIKNVLFPYDISAKDIYELFLQEKNYSSIISRVIISLIILIKRDSDGTRKYNGSADIATETLNTIWCPTLKDSELLTTDNQLLSQCIEAKKQYERQNYSESYQLFKILFSDNDKSEFKKLKNSNLLQNIQCIFAEQLLNGNGCEQNIEEGLRLLESYQDNSRALFLIACVYNGNYNSNGRNYTNKEKYNYYMDLAINSGCTEAIFNRLDQQFALIKPDIASIKELLSFLDPNILNKTDASKYFYCLGLYLELINDPQSKEKFLKSSEFGYIKARAKLNRQVRTTEEFELAFSSDKTNSFCLINSLTDETYSLLKTIPSNYTICLIGNMEIPSSLQKIKRFTTIKESLSFVLEEFPDEKPSNVIVGFFDNDNNKNLKFGLELLDQLYNYAISEFVFNDKNKLALFIDQFEIYIKSEYKIASIYLDASLSDMGDDIYFKTHIIDTDLLTAQKTLYDYPLFLPLLNGDKEVTVALIGSTSLLSSLNEEIMAVGYMGKEHHLNVCTISSCAKDIDNNFKNSAIGLSAAQKIGIRECISPNFISCKKHKLLQSLNSPNEFLTNVANVISKANYFVIDFGDDLENIKFAVELRREILKSTSTLNRKPLILVRCKNQKNAVLAGKLTLSTQKQGAGFDNNYELYFFGMLDSLYSFNNLTADTIEQQALKIHLQYFGGLSFDALNNYYSYYYNQDSSRNTAIGLRYRLFMAGCYNNSASNFSLEQDILFSKEYDRWLKDGNIDYAAQNEQVRWNNFTLSRGWSPAPAEVLSSYITHSEITNHKHLLAKLHPYIANWEDLDENGGIYNTVKQKFPKSTPPQKLTRESIENTVKFLASFKK